MYQLDFRYFWPLTEQIDLDLDYTPCTEYEEEKSRREGFIGNRIDMWGVTSGMSLTSTGNATTWATIKPNSLIVDVDTLPITIRSKTKPNIIARWIYRIIGAKWEAKC